MFLEKHWLTLLLIAVLICMSANARAGIETNKIIENSAFMVERADGGTGIPDIRRWYDSDADVVCYEFTAHVGISCTANNSDVLRQKFRNYKEAVTERKMKEIGLEN